MGKETDISTLHPQPSLDIDRSSASVNPMNIIVAAIGGSLLRPEVEEKHVWLENLISIIRKELPWVIE